MSPMLIHDPVYTFVNLPDSFVKIVDTPEFQRLRQIKQLATVFYRYPGANHTRFEHCIGTFHMAQNMMDFLETDRSRFVARSRDIPRPTIPPKTRMEVEMAALLHDIGHGPFGHTMDFLLDRVGFDKKKRHEYFGVRMIMDSNTEINSRLKEEKLSIENIGRLINGSPPIKVNGKKLSGDRARYYAFLGHIVKSAVSADHIDYLMRDSYYTGVRMVALDLTGILSGLRLHAYHLVPGQKKIAQIDLAFDIGAMEALVSMLLSHTVMYKTVYHDRIHRILQEMIVRAFESYMENRFGDLKKLTEDNIYEIMTLTDDEALAELRRHDESRRIIDRVLGRRYYHFVLEIPWTRMPVTLISHFREHPEIREEMFNHEEKIAKICGLSPREVIIDVPELRYPDVHVRLLERQDGRTYRDTNLEAESDIVKAIVKIPFIDRLTVAVSEIEAVSKVRETVKKTFCIE